MKLQDIQNSLANPEDHAAFIKLLREDNPIRPVEAWHILNHNDHHAKLNTLRSSYPICLDLLGENYFGQLASAYIKAQPTDNHDLNLFGGMFADFIESTRQHRQELYDLPYLADTARIEWCIQSCYYADQSPKQHARLQKAVQSEWAIVPTFAADVQCIRTHFPVHLIRRFVMSDPGESLSLAEETHCYIIAQRRTKGENQSKPFPCLYEISQSEYALAESIQLGCTLEMLFEQHTAVEKTLYSWLCYGWLLINHQGLTR